MKKLWYSLLVIGALAIGVVGGNTASHASYTATGTDDVIQVGFPIQPPV